MAFKKPIWLKPDIFEKVQALAPDKEPENIIDDLFKFYLKAKGDPSTVQHLVTTKSRPGTKMCKIENAAYLCLWRSDKGALKSADLHEAVREELAGDDIFKARDFKPGEGANTNYPYKRMINNAVDELRASGYVIRKGKRGDVRLRPVFRRRSAQKDIVVENEPMMPTFMDIWESKPE